MAGDPQWHSRFPAAFPSAVASALWVNRAYLGEHTLITLSEILSGLALGVLLGVILALSMIVSPAFSAG